MALEASKVKSIFFVNLLYMYNKLELSIPACDPSCTTCLGPNPLPCATCPPDQSIGSDGECQGKLH